MKQLGRSLIVLLLAIPFAVPPADAQPPEPAKEFKGSTTVTVVEIPVTVSRKGVPLRGLSAENFEVVADGRVQKLTAFEVVDLEEHEGSPGTPSAGTPAVDVPSAGRRNFLLFFDLTFTRRHSVAKSIEAARGLLDDMHGSDLAAVAVFGNGSGVRLLQRFTPDRRQVERALDVLAEIVEGRFDPDKVDETLEEDGDAADPLGLLAADPRSLAAEIAAAAGIELSAAGNVLVDDIGGDGTRGEGLQIVLLNEMEAGQRNEILQRKRSSVEYLAKSLAALARMTSHLDGRKYLLQFSEGFDLSVLYGEYEKLGPVAGRSRVNANLNPSAVGVRLLTEMVEAMRQAGWIILAVDPGGSHTSGDLFDDSDLAGDRLSDRLEASDGLAMIAAGTGGDVYENFNDLGDAMGLVLDKTSVTYVLSFQTGEIALDGAFHPVKIRLVGAPRATLSHRPGYYAPRPYGSEDEEERGLRVAQLMVSGDDGGDIDLATLVTPFKTRAGASGLAVWLEASGDALLGAGKSSEVGAEVYVYALDRRGNILDFFARTIHIDEVTAEATLTQGNLKFYGDLVLDPGSYQVRALVRDPRTGRYGLKTVPVQVEPFSTAEVRLLEPVVFDDPTRMYLAFRETSSTEHGAGRGVDESYPFALGSSEFFPAVRPALSNNREVRFCLMAYHLFVEGMQVRASIRRADGTRVEDARLGVLGRSETTFEGLDRFFFKFEPQGLEPGKYTFQVAIGDPGSPTAYSSSTSFNLVSN